MRIRQALLEGGEVSQHRGPRRIGDIHEHQTTSAPDQRILALRLWIGPSPYVGDTFTRSTTQALDGKERLEVDPGRAVHQVIHGRSDPGRFHVRGFSEQGTTTTPFDMVVLNRMSRFHLVHEVLRRASRRVDGWDRLQRLCEERLAEHASYIVEHLEDLPDVADWTWRG